MAVSPSGGPADKDRAFFGHPAGLSTLFFTEMWERFSYYGMRAFLIFYMTDSVALGARGMPDANAGLVIGLYLSSVYLLSLPGGWIADRFLGQRKSVTYGGIAIVIANIMLALPFAGWFYPGLAVMALGTGFLKPNVSTIVGQLYTPEDPRREAGFTIYYMGINIGAFGAPFVCGFLARSQTFRDFLSDHGISPTYSWNFAFAAVAVGMIAGLVQYVAGQARMGEAGLHPTVPSDPKVAARDRGILTAIILALVAIVVLCGVFYDHIETIVSIGFPILLLVITLGLFFGLYFNARDSGERKRVIAMIPLFVGGIIFFGIFEQASSTLNLFAERNTSPTLFGVTFDASYYQSVNSVFIILMAGAAAWLWMALGRRGREPSSVNKFGIGLALIAVAFAVLLPTLAAESQHQRVSGGYLIAVYFFFTCSELCISPVGLSSMSRLAPKRLAGMVMGTWFLATAIGNFLAGQAAGFSAKWGHETLFWTMIIASLVVGGALFAVAPAIRRMLATEEPSPLPKATALSPVD